MPKSKRERKLERKLFPQVMLKVMLLMLLLWVLVLIKKLKLLILVSKILWMISFSELNGTLHNKVNSNGHGVSEVVLMILMLSLKELKLTHNKLLFHLRDLLVLTSRLSLLLLNASKVPKDMKLNSLSRCTRNQKSPLRCQAPLNLV